MKTRRPRILVASLVVALLLSVVPAASRPMASTGDILYNGGFEQGFVANPACGGMVGTGWGCFNNGGTAAYGFYDDMWEPVVYAGTHSQLIEINTKQMGGDANRNAGIYQTVKVMPKTQYDLSLKGMIRADDNGGDPWRYRVYVGFDYQGGTDWQGVSDWRELPWDTYYPRLEPGDFSSYSTKVTTSSPKLTVFVRVERRWGIWYEETDFNLDAISLYGAHAEKPVPYDSKKQAYRPEKPAYDHGDKGSDKPDYDHSEKQRYDSGYDAHPPAEQPTTELVCDGPNLLNNGGFENGFKADGVANFWAGFNNGGRANYGYYDEMWPPVVSQGSHGQLIEINTLDVGDATDPDRVSGIYQIVTLKPGATYQISLDAMMRERNDHSDEDFYRYMVEWGYSKNGGTDPAKMTFWDRVPLDNIYLRTAPGDMQSYSTQFQAPSKTTTIWVFATKKWATLERELDVNLDNVVLQKCRTVTTPAPKPHPKPYPKPQPKPYPKPQPKPYCSEEGDIWYQVQKGDTLSGLAMTYNTTVADIVAKNGLKNANYIYVGQMLCIPDPPSSQTSWSPAAPTPSMTAEWPEQVDPQPAMEQPAASEQAAPAAPATASNGAKVTKYRVQRGDTLSGIAQQFGTTVEALMQANNLSNPNFIYVGQRLTIP